ncbi:glycosyltransferase [Nocardioides sp. YIM 152588]|uniref:glycosyltransferase n=1 Tax=Nocardioides sp. YIM 152588 TaxID=3158259 RepID=UPI0032E4F2AC
MVLVLVGTDHHPFERLVDWADALASLHPELRVVVQHGATRPPRTAEGHANIGYRELNALLSESSVVVCHGGPGVITEAREAGHVPLCVPRDPAHGEHVDGHQLRFAAVVGAAGVVRDIRSFDHLTEEVERSLARPGRPVGSVTHGDAREVARSRVAAELDEVIARGREPRRRRVRRASARAQVEAG